MSNPKNATDKERDQIFKALKNLAANKVSLRKLN